MAFDTDRSFGAIMGDITGHVQQIVRAEIRLAKTEAQNEVAKVRRAATLLLASGVVGVLALGVLLLAAVYALRTVLAPWSAALVVGLISAGVAGVGLRSGIRAMKDVSLRPKKTVETIQETMQWAKTRAR